MTPVSLPDILAPGRAAAETVGKLGDAGEVPRWCGRMGRLPDGVDGADGEGEADSTSHMRCDRVARSFCTVDEREELGET